MAPTARSLGNARLSMLAKPRTLTTRAEFAADIRREWTNALEATVAVGRRLNEAKEALPHGEYEAMVTNDLPFSTSTARKLREIAAFVDTEKVPLDQLPEAMSTLYAIATLPDATRKQALEQGVIRPEVTRAEVAVLKPPKPAAPEVKAPGLFALFASPAKAEEDEEVAADALVEVWTVIEAARSASAQPPALPAPTVIDVEAIPVDTPASSAPAVEKVSSLKGATARPWSVDPDDRCSILAHMEHMKRVALTGLKDDDATATLVQYVVDLHNAKLMGGR
ncbi:DUF3102 domain-containing protein [Azospirillum melinis]|uniref:DUF3102 domain-containing protein n=1 Tax=Azospirillum melinis TaxID=328839 RepID=UPI001FE77D1E|nr:DUF3102 domain-containing protein [Azospirillum melinis]MBP2309406.1 hypothetical protein [Azospirillum melinis]